MTNKETSQIMDILRTAYPRFYANQTEAELKQAMGLWHEMFSAVPVGLVGAAVKSYIKGYKFPPSISEIHDMVDRLVNPPELSELEAWAVVRCAVSGASMEAWSRVMLPDGSMSPPSAVVKFDALPDTIKRVIGSPKQLADWELLDTNHLETVVQSNFMRSFRAVQKSEKKYDRLPADVKAMLGNGEVKLLEGL